VPVERERVTFEAWLPTWIRHEHLARYLFAAERASGLVVVDCACGDGTCARTLANRARAVHGFDLSLATVEGARRRTDVDNVQFAAGDATALPLPEHFADLYVSLETIEHLPDQGSFLREVVRVLKPTGEFLCSTPDRDVYSPGNGLDSRPWNRYHVREFTQPEFAALLTQYFERVELFGQNPKSPTLVNLRRALGQGLPGHLIVRANQALKLPRLLYDRLEHHLVLPAVETRRYEILIAVCSGPRRT
jgi:ubiquinone/menaquinone biosynthesis C-methylase UbiE